MESLHQLTDDKLVKLYKEGNNKAFEVLLSRYQSKVYTYIYLIVRNKELAEDIFQDTFIKAIATIQQDRYVESGKFLAWVNRIAHNLIIDYFRREKNESTFSIEGMATDLLNNAKFSEKSTEDIILKEQILVDVIRLVDELPLTQQMVVKMRFFENLSFKEIAEKTNVSINTALGRMRYALINIRRLARKKNVSLEIK
ncbi:MAG TPA: sigma-70 family RNA polymerase sigma factor [Paludibacteraceae bacterium]|nr:sigma-70 family RNA polymerase sigma factor [Paludibacteraceae bacterium]HOK36761.1 sigma-70 family RNA polymerase sigma factor [Paludibacteraceae bacterium]HOL00993.1 sigma-70 family RNA polymerase sigma factor [Paludibacteraceae bacterium]HPO68050.1 sigma-70 family RNA polymerase sigma factor [Paludibacteraceae bacterium]